MILKLILVNAGVFVFVNFFALFLKASGQTAIGEIPEKLLSMPLGIFPFLKQPWTLFTYMFMHAGVWHIIMNMLWLFWFGQIFELYLGDKKVLPVYLLGGLVGGILAIALVNLLPGFSGDKNAVLVGASGAVFAVVFAAATINPDHIINLIFIGPVRIKYIAGISLLIDIISIRWGNAGGYICHIGGAFMGYYYIRSLQSGRDLGSFTETVKGWFKRKPKLKATYKNTAYKSASSEGVTDRQTQERLDEILDKLSRSGYDSLTKEERDFLFNYSKK